MTSPYPPPRPGQNDAAAANASNSPDVGGEKGHHPSADTAPREPSNAGAPGSDASTHDDRHSIKTDDGNSGKRTSTWRRVYDAVYWVPPQARFDPASPPKFSMALNILFAFAGAFTVANLYYNHPILNILADDFDVPYEKVAEIPTLAQAGYAIGLFFLCPLGDLFKRRPFVLSLVFFTATMSIGLCLTQSIAAFSVIQFFVGLTTVTPQLMLPLVGDLAPPHRRAAALSVVVSGFALGILVARLLSGIMTNFISWRYVYWMSTALQYVIFGMLWYFMPDYPAMNKGLNYFKMLWSILVMLTKHPILVQACIISFFTSCTFTSFWTVLTFLLAGAPYHFDPVIIGLFALVGIGTMTVVPFYARLVIDRFVPAFSVLLGLTYCMIGICCGAYTGTFTIAGPILQGWFLDFGMQTAQIANRSAIYAVEPKARNRVNTAFMVFTFFGQLTGTAVGSHLYARGGWVGSQSFSVGCIGMAFIVTLARGPWEEGWIGWGGGWSIKKKDRTSADGKGGEVRNPLRRLTTKEQAEDAEKARAASAAAEADLEKGSPAHEDLERQAAEADESNVEKAALEEGDSEKGSPSSRLAEKESGIASARPPSLKQQGT